MTKTMIESIAEQVGEDPDFLAAIEEEISSWVAPAAPLYGQDNPDRDRFESCVRALASVRAERERVETMLRRMVFDLDRRERAILHVYGTFAEDYVRRHLRGKAKSLKCPWGVAGFRKQPDRLDVTDESAVLAGVEAGELPAECVRVKREVAKSALNELYKRHGEIPPGCELKPGTDKFYIE